MYCSIYIVNKHWSPLLAVQWGDRGVAQFLAFIIFIVVFTYITAVFDSQF